MNANQPHNSFEAIAVGTWLLVEPTSKPIGPGPCEGYVRSIGHGESAVLPSGSAVAMPMSPVEVGERILFIHHSGRAWERFCIVDDRDVVAVLKPVPSETEDSGPFGTVPTAS